MNPHCVGLIGNGVVVHLPSFFKELDALQSQGLDCNNRLFVSSRAQLVFDFHQIVDGIKEAELGRGRYVSTTFSREQHTLIVFRVALELRRRVSALLTLGKLPGLAFEFTTSSTTRNLRLNSANWSKADTNDTGISNMIPKERSFDTKWVQNSPLFFFFSI